MKKKPSTLAFRPFTPRAASKAMVSWPRSLDGRGYSYLLGTLLLIGASEAASGQNQTWIQQFGDSGEEAATAPVQDGAGGVFMGVSTRGSLAGANAGGIDAVLTRYDWQGNRMWITQFGSAGWDRMLAVAPDGTGGVLACGGTTGNLGGTSMPQSDAWLARFDGLGNQLWIAQLGSVEYDEASVIAGDGVGGAFVAGYAGGNIAGPGAGTGDGWLAYYDSTGSQQWVQQFSANSNIRVNGGASDGTGGVYLCGSTGSTFSRVAFARFDASGNRVWYRTLGSGSSDRATGIIPDGSGGLFMCGHTWSSMPGNLNIGEADAWITRYRSSGSRQWLRQFGTIESDYAKGIAPDGSGGLYVTSSTASTPWSATFGTDDALLARYTANGIELWSEQFGTPGLDIPSGVASDGVGGVFVTGFTGGSLGGPNAGGPTPHDAWIALYETLDIERYCGPSQPNSTGLPGIIRGIGSSVVSDNDLQLVSSQLPMNAFGYFLGSRAQDLVANPGGSQGVLCLGGAIGRYIGPGQVLNSGAGGSFTLPVDLMTLATPTGLVAAQSGDTWHFQAWYRDSNPASTSNFTDAVAIMFL